MKWKLLLGLTTLSLFVLLVAFDANKASKTDFDAEKEIIIMRKIAHQVLLYTGDSSSRILPVKKISGQEFQIPFQSSFSFKPDSLIKIIDRIISSNKLPSSYIVNVLECNTNNVIYGYAVLGKKQNDIVPCLGREQPEMRYCINIRFREDQNNTRTGFYIAGISLLFIPLFIAGIKLYKKKTPVLTAEMKEPEIENSSVSIGKYLFYPGELYLSINGEKTVLTIKEAKLLSIFANNPNQVIDRARLQKEVWEDEGVIVGRSLDMFISKLRKKLEVDPAVKLSNVHGKGYRLEINTDDSYNT